MALVTWSRILPLVGFSTGRGDMKMWRCRPRARLGPQRRRMGRGPSPCAAPMPAGGPAAAARTGDVDTLDLDDAARCRMARLPAAATDAPPPAAGRTAGFEWDRPRPTPPGPGCSAAAPSAPWARPPDPVRETLDQPGPPAEISLQGRWFSSATRTKADCGAGEGSLTSRRWSKEPQHRIKHDSSAQG
jgi:hypothetical protein